MKKHSLSDSFNNAFEGIVHALKTQRNMKIHFFIAVFVLFAAIFFDISKLELILIVFAIILVIAMELINTAIEIIIDMISSEYRIRAKIVKNISAGAVLMAAINAIIVGYLVFLDQIKTVSLLVFGQIAEDPIHFIFVNIFLLIIIVIYLKTKGGKGTPLEGGMPSGHSALAFLLATTVVVFSRDFLVSTLAVFLAVLVAHSRVQSKTHNLLEVIAGAVIGILFGLFILFFF